MMYVQRSRRHSTCLAYKKKAQRIRRTRRSGISVGRTKSVATATATKLKDPPSYSIAQPTKISSSRPILMQENQSTTSQVVSLEAPISQSVSENSQQQPQILDTKKSDSESKTTTGPSITITSKSLSSIEGSTDEGVTNDSIPSRHEQKRQDSSDDTKDKKRSPCDINQIVRRVAETGKTEVSGPPSNKNGILPQQEPNIDIGLEAVGISTNILGMTLERRRRQQSTIEGNRIIRHPFIC